MSDKGAGAMEQFGFDLDEPEKPAPKTDDFVPTHPVRLELNGWIDTLKASTDTIPWDDKTLRHYRTMFPIKAKVLPPEEARFLWRVFEMHLTRLGFQSAE